jgi:hypothetical protein
MVDFGNPKLRAAPDKLCCRTTSTKVAMLSALFGTTALPAIVPFSQPYVNGTPPREPPPAI